MGSMGRVRLSRSERSPEPSVRTPDSVSPSASGSCASISFPFSKSSRKVPCSRAQSWAPVRSPGCRLSSLSERRRGPQEVCSQHRNEAHDRHALSSQNKGPDGSILTVALGFGRLCLSGESRCWRHRVCSLHQALALPGHRTQARVPQRLLTPHHRLGMKARRRDSCERAEQRADDTSPCPRGCSPGGSLWVEMASSSRTPPRPSPSWTDISLNVGIASPTSRVTRPFLDRTRDSTVLRGHSDIWLHFSGECARQGRPRVLATVTSREESTCPAGGQPGILVTALSDNLVLVKHHPHRRRSGEFPFWEGSTNFTQEQAKRVHYQDLEKPREPAIKTSHSADG